MYKFLELFTRIAYADPPAGGGGSGGLVPCGSGTSVCTLKDLGTLLVKIFDFLIILAVPLAILGIAVGGVMIIMSSANEGLRTKGKEAISGSVIGLVLAVAAWVIINTILVGLGVDTEVFRNPLKTGIF
ncbi:MAG TPA: pilin [Candidatus Paceibacterota bacterium]